MLKLYWHRSDRSLRTVAGQVLLADCSLTQAGEAFLIRDGFDLPIVIVPVR